MFHQFLDVTRKGEEVIFQTAQRKKRQSGRMMRVASLAIVSALAAQVAAQIPEESVRGEGDNPRQMGATHDGASRDSLKPRRTATVGSLVISTPAQEPTTITLESPVDFRSTYDNLPDFTFTATHATEPLIECTLWLEPSGGSPTAYGADPAVQSGVSTTITADTLLPSGLYAWWISCTDGVDTDTSETRTITLLELIRGNRTYTSSYDGSTQTYRLSMPDNFDENSPAPLVFYLHGYGQNEGAVFVEFPALVQLYQDNGWLLAAPAGRVINGYHIWYNHIGRSDITDIIGLLQAEFTIDPNHIHFHGRSMGGTGSLQYARFNENVVASIAVIHGVSDFTRFYNETNLYKASLENAFGGTPTEVPEIYADESALGNEYHYRNTPVWIIHGTADAQINVQLARDLYDSLNSLGYTVEYIEVEGAPHNPPWLVYGREQEIFDWFANHPLDLGNPRVTLDMPDDGYWSLTHPVEIDFGCSATDTEGDLVQLDLYMTDGNNENFALFDTAPLGGPLQSATWTVLMDGGTYTWNCRAEDSSGREGWGEPRTLTLAPDTEPPTWDVVPSDQTIALGTSFSYQVSASDNLAVDYYDIDDTDNFTINADTGLIQDAAPLAAGTYPLTISAYDTSSNSISEPIVVTVLPPGAWWNDDWPYRKEILIPASNVPADLTDFPVLISRDDADLGKAQPNGEDLVFTDYLGDRLDHEIEHFSADDLRAWVRLPLLSGSSDTVLYLYYGNAAAANQENPAGVWDAFYKMVHHMEESSGTHFDSTVNANDSSAVSGGVTQGATAQIGGGVEFDGFSGRITVPHESSLALVDAVTFEAWIHPDTLPGSPYWNMLIKGAGHPYQFYLEANTGRLNFYSDVSRVVTSGAPVTADVWQHVAISVDNAVSQVRFYINGSQVGATTTGKLAGDTSTEVHIGAFNSTNYFDGSMDEVRLSRVVRSADWIATSFANQHSPSTFYDVGLEEDNMAVCGNWVIENGEECDDGNTADGDCCSSQCLLEPDDGPCDTGDICTWGYCGGGECLPTIRPYGDVDRNFAVNIFDIYCVLDLIGQQTPADPMCTRVNADIHPCDGDDVLNLMEIFEILNAVGGADPCCG